MNLMKHNCAVLHGDCVLDFVSLRAFYQIIGFNGTEYYIYFSRAFLVYCCLQCI